MIDPRTPVIVGAAQTNEREADCEPVAAMSEVVAAALERSGAGKALASQVGSVRVLQGMWPYRDTGRLVAHECGFGAVQTTSSPPGGNEVYDLVNVTAGDIEAGRLDVAVLCSSEVARTSRRLRARGANVEFRTEPEEAAPDHVYNEGLHRYDAEQIAVGAVLPVGFYAMVESALRHARGESIDAHRTRIADLWARASEVAAANPHASFRRIVSGVEVATASPANRMVAAPYTKLMTANIDVDMAAAVVVCSLGTARAAGIADDDLVFLLAGTGVSDPWEVTKRWALHESPGMRIAARRALELAGTRRSRTPPASGRASASLTMADRSARVTLSRAFSATVDARRCRPPSPNARARSATTASSSTEPVLPVRRPLPSAGNASFERGWPEDLDAARVRLCGGLEPRDVDGVGSVVGGRLAGTAVKVLARRGG